LLIVGGGITGVGIAREAAKIGLRVLLVERGDFAHGSSSRSSKLVHGGLRYLAQGKLRLMLDSVRERERLVETVPGLVDARECVLLDYAEHPLPKLAGVGLRIYDRMAGMRSSAARTPAELLARIPGLRGEGLRRGYVYRDAQTDDARLVLRILADARAAGALALNYVQAVSVGARGFGADEVAKVVLNDRETGARAELKARLVINAAGAWSDRLRVRLGARARMRPLRGSHLVFSAERLAVPDPIMVMHPRDLRPVFLLPWEGVTMVGTTDLDHRADLDREPAISGEEVAYLMELVTRVFPERGLGLTDVLSTWSGVRPVVNSGREDPSKESRDHALWYEHGLLTVTGGKLTTFRVSAIAAVNMARDILADQVHLDRLEPSATILDPVDEVDTDALTRAIGDSPASPELRARLLGRHGARAAALVSEAKLRDASPYRGTARAGALERVPGTTTTWAELRWAAAHEHVVHLDDLLLRRTRIGLCTARGGAALLPAIRGWCQELLAWTDERWEQEVARYLQLWATHYSLPPSAEFPAAR
jgi:glycerol-3-phosphate dehydrogenase